MGTSAYRRGRSSLGLWIGLQISTFWLFDDLGATLPARVRALGLLDVVARTRALARW